MSVVCRIDNFHSIIPRKLIKQEEMLEWLTKQYAYSIAPDKQEKFERYFQHFAVSPLKISQRGIDIPDFLKDCDSETHLYVEPENPPSLNVRMDLYRDLVVDLFESFYKEPCEAPDFMVHVSCTGYIAPSPAQIIIGRRSWSTQVMNAYHMGCYASFPAVRVAQAFAKERIGQQIDVIHTELCSLHVNTKSSMPEQIVISSLFADGHIKYSVHCSEKPQSKGYTILALRERIIKGTSHMMQWSPGQYSFEMTLDREVPKVICDSIYGFVASLCDDAGISFSELLKVGLFAIHPGGPKIIDSVKDRLKLSEEQVASSRKVLFERGNMSSATLPHVWSDLLESGIKPGTLVFSVAFGPGLTIFGGIFRT